MKMRLTIPVISAVILVAALLIYGCDPEDWGSVSYPNIGKYKVTLANEADSCADNHYFIGIDRYVVGAHDNLLPVILNVDSGKHRLALACSPRYRDGTFIHRFQDSVLITGDTTLYIDCDSCHPDY